MTKLANSNECEILRGDAAVRYLGYSEQVRPKEIKTLLLDEEGHLLFQFDEAFTDEQIMWALNFANSAYVKGIDRGVERNQREIRKAFGMAQWHWRDYDS